MAYKYLPLLYNTKHIDHQKTTEQKIAKLQQKLQAPPRKIVILKSHKMEKEKEDIKTNVFISLFNK